MPHHFANEITVLDLNFLDLDLDFLNLDFFLYNVEKIKKKYI